MPVWPARWGLAWLGLAWLGLAWLVRRRLARPVWLARRPDNGLRGAWARWR
jgi:hypothetical protein